MEIDKQIHEIQLAKTKQLNDQYFKSKTRRIAFSFLKSYMVTLSR
jgi:hypothetical protein